MNWRSASAIGGNLSCHLQELPQLHTHININHVTYASYPEGYAAYPAPFKGSSEVGSRMLARQWSGEGRAMPAAAGLSGGGGGRKRRDRTAQRVLMALLMAVCLLGDWFLSQT
jgi:hypothetical protein